MWLISSGEVAGYLTRRHRQSHLPQHPSFPTVDWILVFLLLISKCNGKTKRKSINSMYTNTSSSFIDTRKPGKTRKNPQGEGDAKPKVEYIRENTLFC